MMKQSKHIISSYKDQEKYDIQVVSDLLLAGIIAGNFGPNAVHQHLVRDDAGFINLKKKDENSFEAEYKANLPKKLTIISNVLKAKEDNSVFWGQTVFEFTILSPDLVFIPMNRNDNHYTILILMPGKKQAYYYDPLGKNSTELEKYCKKELGYTYTYNNRAIQKDFNSCGPAMIDFASYAYNLFSQGKEINTEELATFGWNGSKEERDRVKQIRDGQKKALDGYKTGFSIEFRMHYDLVYANKVMQRNINYTFPHKEHIDLGASKRLSSVGNSNWHTLSSWLSASLGMIFGVVITQQAKINEAATSFLVRAIKVDESSANVIFSLTGIAITAAIFAIIGYYIGKELER